MRGPDDLPSLRREPSLIVHRRPGRDPALWPEFDAIPGPEHVPVCGRAACGVELKRRRRGYCSTACRRLAAIDG